jgi:hypothetical protein
MRCFNPKPGTVVPFERVIFLNPTKMLKVSANQLVSSGKVGVSLLPQETLEKLVAKVTGT